MRPSKHAKKMRRRALTRSKVLVQAKWIEEAFGIQATNPRAHDALFAKARNLIAKTL